MTEHQPSSKWTVHEPRTELSYSRKGNDLRYSVSALLQSYRSDRAGFMSIEWRQKLIASLTANMVKIANGDGPISVQDARNPQWRQKTQKSLDDAVRECLDEISDKEQRGHNINEMVDIRKAGFSKLGIIKRYSSSSVFECDAYARCL